MTEAVKVFVPVDAAARSVGADDVAQALLSAASAAGREIQLVRNGSRGMLWLEPLVEVETGDGRVAYGPVRVADVPRLVESGLLDGTATELCHGPTDQIEWLASQQRVTFQRVGVIDPLNIEDYVAHGGFAGLRRALAMDPSEIVCAVVAERASPPASSGRPCTTPRTPSSSCARTPTRATPAPTPTAC